MFRWFRRKSELELLKKQYRSLMRRSYKTALKDHKISDSLRKKAEKIYQEIKALELAKDQE